MSEVTVPIEDNGNLHIVRKAILRGKNYLDIERMYNIPAAVAEDLITRYYEAKFKSQDQNLQRMIQMERLEMLIEPMMDQAMLGNVKASEVLVKHLQSLSELLGLNLQQERVQVEIITDQQGAVIFQMMSYMQAKLLGWVQANFANLGTAESQQALAKIEDRWDDMVAEAVSEARQIQQNAVVEQ